MNMKTETNCTVDGYLKDASFTFHVGEVIALYKDKFPGVENLLVEIKEEFFIDPNKRPVKYGWFHLSEDSKELRIEYKYHKYADKKRQLTVKRNVQSHFVDLRNLLNKAVEHYQELLDQTDEEE